MASRGDDVHGVLSFAIGLISDDGRLALQLLLNTVIQAHPTFRIEVDAFENGLIVRGDDELELMEIREKITPQSEANIGELTISYKESIRRPAEAEGKYIRHTGGLGNYGHAKIRLEPNAPGKDVEFINEIKGGVVPQGFIKPIEHGIRKAALGGILAGYEVVDFKAILYDGSYHDVDSNEMAFTIAGSMAFKEAARKANPVLLEPVMAVEVTVPEGHMGTIIGDFNSRRGHIEAVERTGERQVIRAIIPLAEMLSSSEHGRPRYAMHFAGYQPAPPPHGQFGDDVGAHVRNPPSPKSGAGSMAARLDD